MPFAPAEPQLNYRAARPHLWTPSSPADPLLISHLPSTASPHAGHLPNPARQRLTSPCDSTRWYWPAARPNRLDVNPVAAGVRSGGEGEAPLGRCVL